jgi:hypothetical protein
MDSWLTEQPKSLMELPSDTSVKMKFEALPSPELWIYIKREDVKLSHLAAKVLLGFGTTYLCGEKKSAMTAIT